MKGKSHQFSSSHSDGASFLNDSCPHPQAGSMNVPKDIETINRLSSHISLRQIDQITAWLNAGC